MVKSRGQQTFLKNGPRVNMFGFAGLIVLVTAGSPLPTVACANPATGRPLKQLGLAPSQCHLWW